MKTGFLAVGVARFSFPLVEGILGKIGSVQVYLNKLKKTIPTTQFFFSYLFIYSNYAKRNLNSVKTTEWNPQCCSSINFTDKRSRKISPATTPFRVRSLSNRFIMRSSRSLSHSTLQLPHRTYARSLARSLNLQWSTPPRVKVCRGRGRLRRNNARSLSHLKQLNELGVDSRSSNRAHTRDSCRFNRWENCIVQKPIARVSFLIDVYEQRARHLSPSI